MSTSKPRINVTFEPWEADTIRRLGGLQGRSSSAVVRDLVVQMLPMLERVVTLGETFESASDQVLESMRSGGQKAEELLAPQMVKLERDFVEALRLMESLMIPTTGPDPRPVITGVTHD